MSSAQFLRTLKKLELTVASQRTAQVLGLSIRQCQRLAAGDSPVPGPLVKLLGCYLRHGIPE